MDKYRQHIFTHTEYEVGDITGQDLRNTGKAAGNTGAGADGLWRQDLKWMSPVVKPLKGYSLAIKVIVYYSPI